MEFFYSIREGNVAMIASRKTLSKESNQQTRRRFPKNASDVVVTDDIPPTAAALRALLKDCGLTGSQAAKIVGVSSRTIRKWTSGERMIPPAAWRLLQLCTSITNRE